MLNELHGWQLSIDVLLNHIFYKLSAISCLALLGMWAGEFKAINSRLVYVHHGDQSNLFFFPGGCGLQ